MYTSTHIFTFLLVITFLYAGVYAASPFVAKAQFNQPGTGVTLSFSPETPGPNQEVTATFSGAGLNLKTVPIIWLIDGNQTVSGIGATSITFTTPGFGESTTVRVIANTDTFGTVERSRTITPAEVDLLWEATGAYTPPFYKGKALPTSQEIIKVLAIPRVAGSNTEPSNLSYRWQKNYRYRDLNEQSGHGAQSVVYRKDLIEETERIVVEVSRGVQGTLARETVVIPAFNPQILFYRDHPLYGVQYNKAYENEFPIQARESIAVAEPYYFSINNPEALTYEWKVRSNVIPTENEDRPNELTFRTEGGSGQIDFSLSVTHPDYILQLLNTTITAVFGEQGSEQQNPFSL